jgi:serine/threonine protein kinase
MPTSHETFTEWRHFIDDRDPPFDQDSLPPLLALINRCLDPIPSKRPSPDDIIRLAREGVKGFREYFNHSDEKHRSGLFFRDHEIKDIPPTEIPKKQWPTMHLQNLHAVKYGNSEAPLRLPALIYGHPANLEDHPSLNHYNDIHFNKEKVVFEVGVSPSPRFCCRDAECLRGLAASIDRSCGCSSFSAQFFSRCAAVVQLALFTSKEDWIGFSEVGEVG